MKHYEEHTKWNTFWSWFVVFAISGSLLSWAMIMMTFVEDVPREWDFGNLEFTPAKSEYSSFGALENPAELMLVPLPEGISMEEESAKNNSKDEKE